MNTSIIYASKTGHSKKIANTIGSSLNITPQNIKDIDRFENTDLLFIVGGIYGNQSAPELMKFVQELDPSSVKQVSLITSSFSNSAKQKDLRELLISKNIKVLDDEYLCKGSFLFLGLSHPNKTERAAAVNYVKKIIESSDI